MKHLKHLKKFNELNEAQLSDFVSPGDYEIWYYRRDWDVPIKSWEYLTNDEYMDEFPDMVPPDINNLEKTHIKLGSIDASDFNDVFHIMNTWGQGEPTNKLLDELGISHTSMSIGDIIKYKGKFYYTDDYGFRRLPDGAKVGSRGEEHDLKEMLDNENEKRINESENHTGEYTVEEMDAFVREIIDLMEWSDDSVPMYKRNEMLFPDDRNSSSVTNNREDAIEKWESSMDRYKDDKDPIWFVWNLSAGGAFSKIKPERIQRYNIEEILKLARKYPEAIRRVQIGVDSKEQSDFGRAMRNENWGD